MIISSLTGTHVINWNSFWQSGQRFVMVAQLSMHTKQNLESHTKNSEEKRIRIAYQHKQKTTSTNHSTDPALSSTPTHHKRNKTITKPHINVKIFQHEQRNLVATRAHLTKSLQQHTWIPCRYKVMNNAKLQILTHEYRLQH